MRIVVLDGFTANPGDLSWEAFTRLGELVVHDRTPESLVIERAREAEAVITNKTKLQRQQLAELPRLRYIGVIATGYNVVDAAAARERGIVVCNVPEYATLNVVQAVFALLLELTLHTGHHAETVRDGKWSACKDFAYWDFPLIGLPGLTLGLVGYGRIGRAVGRAARAFGMNVIASRRRQNRGEEDGVRFVELDRLFSVSDVASLHCPLTPETDKLVNAARLERMKHTAYVINTARGGVVDEAALAEALNQERIAGAGLDVLSVEPPPPDNPLLKAKNCIITPHIGWATRDARIRLLQVAADNLRAWQSGRPQNVVGR